MPAIKNYAALMAISAVSALRHNPGAQIELLGYNLETAAQELVRSRVVNAGGDFLCRDVSPAVDELKAWKKGVKEKSRWLVAKIDKPRFW